MRQEFVGEEAGVRSRIGILDKPILRVQEGCNSWDNLAAVNEIVEHDLRRGVLQEVAAIVNDQ
jgi:hypothetical protein